MSKHILMIEDDRDIAQQVKSFLEDEGMDVSWAQRLSDVKERKLEDYDLILLDLMLPDGPGHQVLKMSKNFTNYECGGFTYVQATRKTK